LTGPATRARSQLGSVPATSGREPIVGGGVILLLGLGLLLRLAIAGHSRIRELTALEDHATDGLALLRAWQSHV